MSTLAQTLVDEGPRMAEHPGIDERGPAVVSAAAEVFDLPEAEIARADAESTAAEARDRGYDVIAVVTEAGLRAAR